MLINKQERSQNRLLGHTFENRKEMQADSACSPSVAEIGFESHHDQLIFIKQNMGDLTVRRHFQNHEAKFIYIKLKKTAELSVTPAVLAVCRKLLIPLTFISMSTNN